MDVHGPLVVVQGLTKQYKNGPVVLKGVSFELPRGVFAAVIGKSGSGKTTLLNILGALDTDYLGRVFVDGVDLSSVGPKRLARFRNETIGFVFQAFHLIPHLTALENVLLPALVASRTPSSAHHRAHELLELLGLEHRIQYLPSQLSAGEKQRVAIARALLMDPILLLADEPTGNLDPDTGKGVVEVLRGQTSKAKTVIIVTHNQDIANTADLCLEVREGLVEVKG